MALAPEEQIQVDASRTWVVGSEGASNAIASSLDAAPLAVIVDLVRTGFADTRPRLAVITGLSRKVVAQRVDQACENGLLKDAGLAHSEGGRQARRLEFNADAGYVFGVLIEASEITLGISDLRGRLLATAHEDWSVDNGPELTMQRVKLHLDALASRTGVARPWGIGVGVPGPVDYSSSRLVSPPIMPGWDGFSARSWLREHYDAPVWVDNDVNVMAIGEWAFGTGSRSDDMLFIKAGTGVGAAIISRGRLLRGQRGAAGDIGHMHVTDDPQVTCRCGQTGCLEAVAGGWSLLEEATRRSGASAMLTAAIADHGHVTLGDIGVAAHEGDPLSLEMLLARAQILGEVAASLVNFVNPGQLVIGGGVLRAGTEPLNRIKDVVLRRSTRLASEGLTVRAASLDQMEGVIGAALLAAENLLAPPALARWVEDASPLGHATALQRHDTAFV
ncbi:ROK family protein [Microbacterium lacus]|uniref:ROK family protein n=1 Tax=Microbacterium lacus TaxID=415217 RepID=UPI003850077D